MAEFIKVLIANLHDTHHTIHQKVGKYPALYYPIYGRKYPANYISTSKDTQICIEGFPRSGNTYSVSAFKLANKGIKISHHLHVPAQVLLAVQYQIPTIVVIRNPLDAVTSLLILKKSQNADIYLKSYIDFYEAVKPVLHKIVLADFKTVINDFNSVIHSLNEKFNSEFKIVENIEKRKDEIFAQLEQLNKEHQEGDLTQKTYPDAQKEKYKSEIKQVVRENKFLEQAQDLYKKLLKTAI